MEIHIQAIGDELVYDVLATVVAVAAGVADAVVVADVYVVVAVAVTIGVVLLMVVEAVAVLFAVGVDYVQMAFVNRQLLHEKVYYGSMFIFFYIIMN